jgi:hypothetical protein
MNRIREYTAFAARFAGLGYIVLWPLSSSDISGKPFGAAVFCGDGSLRLLDMVCHSEHPLLLPPTLHMIGLLSAVFAASQLLLYALRRSRRAAGAGAAIASARSARIPAVPAPPPRRKPAHLLRSVKPRAQFGLRGVPH